MVPFSQIKFLRAAFSLTNDAPGDASDFIGHNPCSAEWRRGEQMHILVIHHVPGRTTARYIKVIALHAQLLKAQRRNRIDSQCPPSRYHARDQSHAQQK